VVGLARAAAGRRLILGVELTSSSIGAPSGRGRVPGRRQADLEACDVWAVDPSPASANEAARSDVPFLVLAGDLDTVSSPEWADAFAEGLSDTQVIHFAGLGTQPTGPPETTAQQCARHRALLEQLT